MIHLVLTITLCCLTVAGFAATAPSRAERERILPAPDGQRFLFIVETSSSTGRTQAETEAALFDLIASGVYRAMRPGDTYGLWTYNKVISAGEFPMQIWDSRNASQLGTIAAAYLSDREFEKSGDVKRMMTTVQSVIHSVSNLNIFIVSNGDSPVTGTPFDKAINAEYKEQRRERRKAGKPFITTLVVRDGWIIHGAVSISGTPIDLPARPLPVIAQKQQTPVPVPAPTAPKAAAEAPQSPPAPLASSIAAASSSNAAPPSVTVVPQKPRIIQIITRTNVVDPSSATVPAALAATTATTATPAIRPVPAPAEMPTPISPAPEPAPITTLPTAASTPVPPTVPAESVVEPAPLESGLAALIPQPLVVSARESQSAASAGPSEPQPPPAIQAAAIPSTGGIHAGLLIAFGGLLLSAAVFLLLVVFRQQRPTPQGSLITQSMNQR
jgi:hypothetical protein